MATVINGILGSFTGTAGPVSGYMRNGKNFMRSRPRKSTAPMSPKRLAQQQKIKVCNDFTRPFCGTGFFNKTFPAYGHSGTGFNRATGAIMNLAIVGTYPNTSIDYPEVLISKGPLPPARNPTTAVSADGSVLFTWEDNSGNGTARPDDKVILVAYFPAVKMARFSIGEALRRDCEAVMTLPHMENKEAETWIGFLNHEELDAADSVYSGRVNL